MSLMDVLALGLLLWTFSAYEVVSGYPTPEQYENITCQDGFFKCPPHGSCCKSDSQMCSTQSQACESMFLPGEDEDYECCNVLFNNGSSRVELIQLCTNRWRVGSSISREYCKAKYPGEPKGEIPSTPAETPTVVPTQPKKEQVTPSSEEPKGEPSSTAAETKPPPTVVPTQPQQDQVLPKSSSDCKLSVALGVVCVALILCVVALILCVVFTDKVHRVKYKLIRKCRKACCCRPTCQRERENPSTSSPDDEPNSSSVPLALINMDSPESEPETPKDVPVNPPSEAEHIPTVNLGNRTLTKAQNSQIEDTAGTRENGLNDARCPTCHCGGTVSMEMTSTSSPETPDDEPGEQAIDPPPNPKDRAISLVELEQPDYSTETDKLLGEDQPPAQQRKLD